MTDFIPMADEEKAQFHEQGFVVLPGVLDAQTVARVSEAGDRLALDESGAFRHGYLAWEGVPNCLSQDPTFHPLLTHPRTLSALVQLLGPHIHLLASNYIITRSLSPQEAEQWKPRWHRDLYGTSRDLGRENLPLMAIKAAFILTDHLEPRSGMTLFSPGTHRERTAPLVTEGRLYPENTVEPQVRAGDVVLFENRLGHSAGLNTSGRRRRCVMLNYGYRWLMPFDYAGYEEAFQAQFSPLGRALFARPRFPLTGQDPSEPILEWAAGRGRPGFPSTFTRNA